PEKIKKKQADLHGIIFKNTLPPKAPPRICRLSDTLGNVVVVAKLESKNNGVTVTTPSGAKLDFTFAQVAQIDYSTGRFDYLSALTGKLKTKITLNPYDKRDGLDEKHKWFIYSDSNLHNKPIKLGGTSYRHGLTLVPEVELEYDLNSEYRQF